MVNETVDIAQILSIRAGRHLSDAYELHKHMSHALPQNEYFSLRNKERESCIEAVILFQASLEAIINEELESADKLLHVKQENEELNRKYKLLSFKNKWLKSFEALAIGKDGMQYLDNYLRFYIKFRVPITHAKSRYMDAEKYNFLSVYEGIKNGYCAVECFYKKLGKLMEEHSWETFCQQTHLPLQVSETIRGMKQ